MRKVSRWVFGSLGIMVLFIVLLMLKWESFPLFVDLYYHGASMMGFEQAGGIPLRDFWEYAPFGRPHVYPPLLHILMLALSKIGLSTLSILRLVCVLIYPSVLWSIWWVSSKVYSDRKGFFILVAATIPYTFFLTVVNAVPASFGMIIIMLLFYAVEKKKTVAGGLLFGLLFYAHAGLPWLAILAFSLYAIVFRKGIKALAIMISFGLLLASPWLIHTLGNKGFFVSVNLYENRFFEGYFIFYLLSIFGLQIVLKKRGLYLFPLILWVAMLPMIFNYRYRFLCGQGLLPLILLAGFALEKIYMSVNQFLVDKKCRGAYLILLPCVIFYVVTFFTPAFSWNGKSPSFQLGKGSALSNMVSGFREDIFGSETSIYNKELTQELVLIIKANTEESDVIYCNDDNVGVMLSMLTGRVTANAMLREVRPFKDFDPYKYAGLIIALKKIDGTVDPEIMSQVKKNRLRKVGETGIACLYKNAGAQGQRQIAKPLIPAAIVFAIFTLWICVIILKLRM